MSSIQHIFLKKIDVSPLLCVLGENNMRALGTQFLCAHTTWYIWQLQLSLLQFIAEYDICMHAIVKLALGPIIDGDKGKSYEYNICHGTCASLVVDQINIFNWSIHD